MKIMEHELIDHNDNGKVVARVWMSETGKVKCDNPDIMKFLETADIDGHTVQHGYQFMEKFPKLFRGSYITARKVKNGN